MEDFPLLLPEDTTGQTFVGYLTLADGHEVVVRVANTSWHCGEDSPPHLSLKVSQEVATALAGERKALEERLGRSKDVASFLVELRDVLERTLRGQTPAAVPPAMVYTRIIEEMDHVGWDALEEIGADLTSIRLRLRDAAGRSHSVLVTLPPDYPSTPPTCTCDLPIVDDIRWSGTSTLGDVCDQFRKMFERFQEFWTVVDDLDAHVWVLEPETPQRGTTTRRIALGHHCSLQLDLNPLAPRDIPGIRFLGADNAIASFKQHVNENLDRWNREVLVRENLECVLGMALPSPSSAPLSEFTEECCICYTYRLGSLIPDRTCDNVSCRRSFHRPCLVEWLRSLPSSRVSFDTIFGSCPYCSHPLSVKVS